MDWKRLLLCLSLLASCTVLGCGSNIFFPTAPAVPVVPVPLDLNGNWLIAGDLPVFASALEEPPGQLDFAATLFVRDKQLSGGGVFTRNGCFLYGAQNFSFSGTVQDDGTFHAQVPPGQGFSLTFSGKAPPQQGEVWIGTYTFTETGCPTPTVTSAFTSQALGAVAGTYTGASSLGSPLLPQNNIPVSITLNLQQGAVPGNALSNYGVIGSITVEGSPCFHSGSSTSNNPSAVEGNGFTLNFTLDDGSQLSFLGQFTDFAAKTLSVPSAVVLGGSCDGETLQTFTLSR